MDETAEFFEYLGRQKHLPLLEKAEGTVRFDVANGKRSEHIFITLDRGDVSVSKRMAAADCIIGADRDLLNGIVRGDTNVMAALLRGAIHVEGDPRFAVLIQRLFSFRSIPQAEKRPSAERKSR